MSVLAKLIPTISARTGWLHRQAGWSGHPAPAESSAAAAPRSGPSWRRLGEACCPGGFDGRHLMLLMMVAVLPACAATPLVQGFELSSYEGMKPSDGLITKSRINVRKEQVLAAGTVKFLPTAFSPSIGPKLSGEQRALIANAVNRALCISVSDRLKVVAPDQPADLVVKTAVTHVTETDEVAAGVSAAVSLGMNFVDVGAPIPTPRIPIGLGNLSMEAEALDPAGRQQASMIWGRGANALFNSPRASKSSDAYDLAAEFGGDFGRMLVKGESPFDGVGIDLPSWQKINSAIGLPPKYAACERYGRAPGIRGLIGGQLGLPPEWTDKGSEPAPQ